VPQCGCKDQLSWKKSNVIGTWISDLPACSILSQPTMLQRAPDRSVSITKCLQLIRRAFWYFLLGAREEVMKSKEGPTIHNTPWRRMGKFMYGPKFSCPRHELEVSGQLHAPAALHQVKSPRYPLDKRLGGP
jgi:hypothetical protein